MPRNGAAAVIEFEVQRCTRRCAATNRPFAPGEVYYSALRNSEQGVVRRDYCETSWHPPQDAIAWWRSRAPDGGPSGAKLAPNEVLLRLFDEWADEPTRAEARYVLALLLVRRKVFRMREPRVAFGGEESQEPANTDLLHVECPSRDQEYQLAVASPDATHAQTIQAELNQLLFADAA